MCFIIDFYQPTVLLIWTFFSEILKTFFFFYIILGSKMLRFFTRYTVQKRVLKVLNAKQHITRRLISNTFTIHFFCWFKTFVIHLFEIGKFKNIIFEKIKIAIIVFRNPFLSGIFGKSGLIHHLRNHS